MLSFILALGLSQTVASAECAGGLCTAKSAPAKTSSCASGSCSSKGVKSRFGVRGSSRKKLFSR